MVVVDDKDRIVLRKLVAPANLDWFIALEIDESTEKSAVFLHRFDIRAEKTLSCVDYLSLNSRLK